MFKNKPIDVKKVQVQQKKLAIDTKAVILKRTETYKKVTSDTISVQVVRELSKNKRFA